MLKAEDARVITNSSTAKFKSEIERIDSEIRKRAENGFRNAFISQVPAEISEQIADEYCINGYTVKHERGTTKIDLEW